MSGELKQVKISSPKGVGVGSKIEVDGVEVDGLNRVEVVIDLEKATTKKAAAR